MMLVTTPVVLEEGGLDEFYIYQKGLHFLMVVLFYGGFKVVELETWC